MSQDEFSTGPHIFPVTPPAPPAPPARPPEETVLHRRHAVAAFWQIVQAVIVLLLGAAGGYITRDARANKTVDLSAKDALSLDTLPSRASRNPARILSFTQGLGLLVVQEGQSFTYRIDAADASACQLVSPVLSGAA